jgi:hypothetical protein
VIFTAGRDEFLLRVHQWLRSLAAEQLNVTMAHTALRQIFLVIVLGAVKR